MIQKFKNGMLISRLVERKITTQIRHVNLTSEQKLSVSTLFDGLINNKRPDLAKAITLIETTNQIKKLQAQELLTKVLQHLKDNQSKNLKKCLRVGIKMIFACLYSFFK